MKPTKGIKQVVKAVNNGLDFIPIDLNTKEFLEDLFNIKLTVRREYVKVRVKPHRRRGAIVRDYTQKKFLGHCINTQELLEKIGKSRFTKKILKTLEKTK